MNFSALKMYGRFAWGLHSHLRDTITLAEAESIIRRRMEAREDSFLRIVEKGIFNNARSPYLPLLRAAGCGLGDVRKLVRTRGLEGALEELRRADIHVTFEEFKGRKAIQRNGCDYVVQPNDFDNPYLKGHYESETGGSTGAGTRVSHDLEHLAAQCPHVMVGCQRPGGAERSHGPLARTLA